MSLNQRDEVKSSTNFASEDDKITKRAKAMTFFSECLPILTRILNLSVQVVLEQCRLGLEYNRLLKTILFVTVRQQCGPPLPGRRPMPEGHWTRVAGHPGGPRRPGPRVGQWEVTGSLSLVVALVRLRSSFYQLSNPPECSIQCHGNGHVGSGSGLSCGRPPGQGANDSETRSDSDRRNFETDIDAGGRRGLDGQLGGRSACHTVKPMKPGLKPLRVRPRAAACQ